MLKCSFQTDWLSKFTWLKEVPDNKHMAYCSLCNNKFSLSNMGVKAVTSHQKGKKHILKANSASGSIKNIFASRVNSTTDSAEKIVATNKTSSLTDSITEVSKCSNVFSSGIEKYFMKENVLKAEVRWCLEVVMNHRSLKSAEKDVKEFLKMFIDSEIAKHIQLWCDKIAYTLLYGILPFFKEILLKDLLVCSHFVIGFDESLNKISQRQQMDINIRYWCNQAHEVKTRYFNSAFLGHSCSLDLLNAFKDVTQSLQLKRLFQVSMDGPNVKKKIFRELSALIKENPDDPEVLNIGTCGLHAVNAAFKAGAKCTGSEIVEFNRAIYYLFKDSPAR